MSTLTLRPRAVAAAGFAIAAVALVGCGDPDAAPSLDRGSLDAEGSTTTTEAESTETDPTESSEASSDAASSIADAARRSVEQESVTVRTVITADGEPVAETTVQTAAGGGAGKGQLEMPPFGLIDYLFVDGAMYYSFPDLPAGKEWVKMSFDEVTEQSGVDPAEQDPSRAFDVLESVSDDATEVGAEAIDGVATTQYRFTTNFDELVASAVESGAITEEYAELGDDLPGEAEVDVWIDDDGLVRRIAYELVLTDPSSGEPATFGYLLEFSDFGEPLELTVPDPATVMDMSEMMGGLGEGLPGEGDHPAFEEVPGADALSGW